MTAPEPAQPSVSYDVRIQPEFLGGVYANFASVWHTVHEFTLDFASTLPAEQGQQDDGAPLTVVPAWVTARVKLPPTVVFDLIRTLNENMTRYEQRYGPIAHPGTDEPTFPPDDLISGPDEEEQE